MGQMGRPPHLPKSPYVGWSINIIHTYIKCQGGFVVMPTQLDRRCNEMLESWPMIDEEVRDRRLPHPIFGRVILLRYDINL